MNRFFKGFAALSLAFAIQAPILAQESHNIEAITRVGSVHWETSSAVAIDGDLAFVLDEGVGVHIVDISQPRSPRPFADFQYAGTALDIAVAEGIFFIAGADAGVTIVDVNDPDNPEEIASIQNAGNARGVNASNSYLYVSSGAEGVAILDVSDPANPERLSFCPSNDFALKSIVEGNTLYFADRAGGLQIADISDPEHPEIVGSVGPSGETRDLVYSNGFVYLAETQGVSKIDVSDPTHPSRVAEGHINQPAMAIATNGDYVYAAQTAYGVLSMHNINAGLQQVGMLILAPTGPCDVAFDGEYVWTASHRSGLRSIDISNPANPLEFGRCGSAIEYGSVALAGNLLYTGTGPVGAMCYNISNPEEPALIWQNSPRYSVVYNDVTVDGGLFFSAEESSHDHPLRIGETNEDGSISWRGSTSVDGDPGKFAVGRNRLYCVTAGGYTNIYDTRNIAQPNEIGTLWTQGRERHKDISVVGEIGYIAATGGGLMIFDMSDPAQIRQLGQYMAEDDSIGFDAYSIKVRGNFAYLGTENSLDIVNIAEPRNPQVLGSVDLPDDAVDIFLDRNLAYVACGRDGVYAIDISDPENPYEYGFFNTPGEANEVTVSDSVLYVADETGLGIYRLLEDEGNPPVWNDPPEDIEVIAGQLVEFSVSIGEWGNDIPGLSLVRGDLPDAAQFTDNSDGSGSFTWRTNVDDAGTWQSLFIASNSYGVDSAIVEIRVLAGEGVGNEDAKLPTKMEIVGCFPNPFNSSTTISYSLPSPGRYALDVVDIQGRLVTRLADGWREAGSYREVWNGLRLDSGVYLIRLDGPSGSRSEKIVLLH